MVDDGGSAFPTRSNGFVGTGQYGEAVAQYSYTPGMTLRDYFAGQALTGLCANDGIEFDEEAEKLHPIYAKHAYKMADAMLAERSKT